jgi:hypothetical protein
MWVFGPGDLRGTCIYSGYWVYSLNIMVKKNSIWAKQYDSIRMHIPFWKKILHFIRPPYMQDPKTGKIYSKYGPEGVFIKTIDKN